MASSSISNHEAHSNQARESKRIKRRKIESENLLKEATIRKTKWKTAAEHQIYTSKLVEALRQARRNSFSRAADTLLSGRAVRDTADRVLAVAAKGTTRWSRSILTSRLRLSLSSKHKKVRMTGGNVRSKKPMAKKTLSPLQRKARVLSRLVPGCRKVSFPNLLDEATDYISALEMQVRAMTALAGILTGAQSPAVTFDRLGSNIS